MEILFLLTSMKGYPQAGVCVFALHILLANMFQFFNIGLAGEDFPDQGFQRRDYGGNGDVS